ncbi:hypothetical protein BGZ52_007737 [Haplosporangium bisporale]|nr:hypothetical protein BGZ52_007737 [Haplosporangium bisporale]
MPTRNIQNFQAKNGTHLGSVQPPPWAADYERIILWRDVQDAFVGVIYLQHPSGNNVLFMTDKNGELHRPLRIKHEYSPYTVIFSRNPEYHEQESRRIQLEKVDPSSSMAPCGIQTESQVRCESLPPIDDLFEIFLHLSKRLEKSVDASRDDFHQAAANTRYFCTVLDKEIHRVKNTGANDHGPILQAIREQEQRIPEWDLHNICYHMLSDYTDEAKWDFATSRLFIVLPSDLDSWNNPHSWNDLDPTTHRFRLYFLCDNSNRDTWGLVGPRNDIPQHAHISNHPGYNLKQPQQFFRVYGDYVQRVLRMVKHGYPRGYHKLPSVDSFQILWGCDANTVGHLTKDTLGPLVDKALAYIQELSPPKWEKRFVLTHNLSASIKTHLDAQQGDNGESNLQRYITYGQRVYWMCESHTHQFFDTQYLRELQTFVHSRGGNVDMQQAMLKITLTSAAEADHLRTLLRLAKCTLNLSIKLADWQVTRSYMQEFCLDVEKTGTVILEIDGITPDIRPPECGRFRKTMFSNELNGYWGLQLVTLLNYPQPQEQCIHLRDGYLHTTLPPVTTVQNWMDLKSSMGKLVHSVYNARGASKYSYGREAVRSALAKHGFPMSTVVYLNGKTWAAVFDLEQGDITEVHSIDMDYPKFVISSGCLRKMTVDLKHLTFDADFVGLARPYSQSLQQLTVSCSGNNSLCDIEHFIRSWPYTLERSFHFTLLDRVSDIHVRVVAELDARPESSDTQDGVVAELAIQGSNGDLELELDSHIYRHPGLRTPLGIEFVQWGCDQVSAPLQDNSALFLDMASAQHPSVLTMFTLDVTPLSRAGLASIQRVLSRSNLQTLTVACTPVDPSLSDSIVHLLDSVTWSSLKALVLSGENIDEWLQLWPTVTTPQLVSLEICGTSAGVQRLSHSSMLSVHRLIYVSPLIELYFANVQVSNKSHGRRISDSTSIQRILLLVIITDTQARIRIKQHTQPFRGILPSQAQTPSINQIPFTVQVKIASSILPPTAPATYSDYFGNDAHEANESRFREEQARSLDEQQDQDPWLAHLFDELSNDDPLEYHSSRFESLYHNSVRGTGSGAGHSSKYDHLNSLSDDNYANYMRRGMSSRSNHRNTAAQKEEQEWAEWVQDQERIKYRQERDKQREKDERARQRRQERIDSERGDATNKVSMDSAINVLRKKTLVDKARMEYDEGWVALMDRKVPVSENTIPWPPSTTASGSGTPTTTTSTTAQSMDVSLYEFLFLGTPAEKTDIRRQLLRREQLKFHPDKFKQRFGTRLPMNAIKRQAILDRVEGVAQELNEIGELLS